MITDTPNFWTTVAQKDNWRDYILPGKTFKEFYDSGIQQAKLIRQFSDKLHTVLDYGCGVGRVLKHVAPMFKTAYGMDVCPEFINKAKVYCQGVDNILFERPKNNSVDVVYCLMVMQHNTLQKRKEIMLDIHTLLKKDGKAIIQFPDSRSNIYKETDFVHKFTPDEIRELASIFDFFSMSHYNLAAYQNEGFNPSETNELLLIATK